MPAKRRQTESEKPRKRKPATTPEAREAEITSLAYDLAERQIKEGTASSQVITHFIKAGSPREQFEQEKLRLENELLEAKREALESQKRVEELYKDAMRAFSSYSGQTIIDDEVIPEDD